MQKITLWLIRAYQYGISPLMASHCRFYPSCSSYALTAVERFGFTKGMLMAIKRLSHCHPWHPGGYDPVPNKTDKK